MNFRQVFSRQYVALGLAAATAWLVPSVANAYCLKLPFLLEYESHGTIVPAAQSLDVYLYVNGKRSFDEIPEWSNSKFASVLIAAAQKWNEVPGDHPRFIYRGILEGSGAIDYNDFPHNSLIVHLAFWDEFEEPWKAAMDAQVLTGRGDNPLVDDDKRVARIRVSTRNLAWVGKSPQDVLVHELGHILGLGHNEDAFKEDGTLDEDICVFGAGPSELEHPELNATAMNHANDHGLIDEWLDLHPTLQGFKDYRQIIWRDDIEGLSMIYDRSAEHSPDECDPDKTGANADCTCAGSECRDYEVACARRSFDDNTFRCFHGGDPTPVQIEYYENNGGNFENERIVPPLTDDNGRIARTIAPPSVSHADDPSFTRQVLATVDDENEVLIFERWQDDWCYETQAHRVEGGDDGRTYGTVATAVGNGDEAVAWLEEGFLFGSVVHWRIGKPGSWREGSIDALKGGSKAIGLAYLAQQKRFLLRQFNRRQEPEYIAIDPGLGGIEHLDQPFLDNERPEFRSSSITCWVYDGEDWCLTLFSRNDVRGNSLWYKSWRVHERFLGGFEIDRVNQGEISGRANVGAISLIRSNYENGGDQRAFWATFLAAGTNDVEFQRLSLTLKHSAGEFRLEDSAFHDLDGPDEADGWRPHWVPVLGSWSDSSGGPGHEITSIDLFHAPPPTHPGPDGTTRCCTPGLCDGADPNVIWPDCPDPTEPNGEVGCGCAQLLNSSLPPMVDGYFPDGEGSMSEPIADGGRYCIDDSLQLNSRVCAQKTIDWKTYGYCHDCAAGGAVAGCACTSDLDCQGGGDSSLVCWGATSSSAKWGQWLANPVGGVCLPDPYRPGGQVEPRLVALDWICKESCAALGKAQDEAYTCMQEQDPVHFDEVNGNGNAKCVSMLGCADPDTSESYPPGGCEASGRRCLTIDGNPRACVRECDPQATIAEQNARCQVLGFPAQFVCATGEVPLTFPPGGSAPLGHCVPPQCADGNTGSRDNECLQFH